MASFDYTKMAAVAITLLKKFGALTPVGDGATLRQVNAVKLQDVKHTFGDSEIQIGDIKYIASPQTSTGADSLPKRSERFTSQYVIVQTESIKPADVVLAW